MKTIAELQDELKEAQRRISKKDKLLLWGVEE